MADKDKAPTQADYDKAWEDVKKNPKSAPKFIDGMPPKETPDIKKGLLEGLKGYSPSKEVKKFDDNYKQGGKVSSASKRADGCAIRGKTRA
jgi:hypothetical protein